MNCKHLIITLLGILALTLSCQRQEKNLGLPSIEINQSSASVEMPSSSFSMMVLTNRSWRATADVPWIAIDPDSGSGDAFGQTVTITVMENTSYTRSGHVTFDIVYDSATLTVDQAGNGSPEDYIIYYNDFDKETATQAYGSSGTSWPFLDQFEGWKNETGVGVAGMSYDFANVSARNNSNSNGSYSDYAGSGLNNLLFGASGHFAVKNLSLKDFKNFRLSFGTEKYDNNNKTALFDPAELPVYVSADGEKWIPLSYSYLGTAAGRWNVAEAVFSVPEDVKTLSVYVMATVASAYRVDDLKIEVSEEAGTVLDFSNGSDLPSGGGGGGGGDSDYENAPAKTVQEFISAADQNTYYKLTGKVSGFNATYCSFDLTDDSGKIYVYSVDNKDAWSSKIKNGGTVTLAGKYLYYESKSQHEVVNAYILSFTEGEVTPPSGDVKSVTVAEFQAAPESDSQVYELVGTIGGSINSTYGNFDLADETGTVYVYGLTATNLGYGTKNDKSYASLGLNEGDKIKIRGYRGSFNDKIEVMYAWFIEKVSGGDDTPSGDVKSVTVAQFIAAPESDKQVYELVGTIGGSINTTYGNFDLTDDSGTVYVYGLTATNLGYGTKNDKSYASLGLNEGDKIKIRGYRGSFNDKIEVMYAWFIEKVSGGGGGGDDTPGGSSVSFSTNADAQTWAADTDGTYGSGFATTTQGLKIGYYKHTSTSNPVAPNANHIRVYKNSALSIGSTGGKKIKKIVLGCAPNAGTSSYCFDMVGLEGGASATADKSALTVSWTGSASKVVLHASNGQVRVEKITVEFE